MVKSGKKDGRLLAGYAAIAALLFFWNNYHLALSALPDYDSTSNFLVARAILAGDFSGMFRHACPLFNLLLACGLKLGGSYLVLEYLNTGFILAGALVFARFAAREFKFGPWLELATFALIGSSVTLTHLGRSLTFEPLSFWLFSLFFRQYFRSFYQKNDRHFFTAVLLFALLFTANYKALMLLPIILVTELLYRTRIVKPKLWFFTLLIPTAVFIGFAALGALFGLSFFRYPAVFGSIFLEPDDHPYREFTMFNADLLFYFRYLFSFENPFLLAGLLLFPFTVKITALRQKPEISAGVYVAIFAYCILAGMTLLQKAPRGLLFAYPLFYLMALVCCNRFLKRPALILSVLLGMVAFNGWSVYTYLLKFSKSNYPQLAAQLREMGVKKVAVTMSNRLIPLLPETEVKVIKHHSQLAALKDQGFEYLIIDDFYQVTCMAFAPRFRREIQAYPEEVLLSPVFILEHCEYSGLSYAEGLAIAEKLQKQRYHLRLVQL